MDDNQGEPDQIEESSSCTYQAEGFTATMSGTVAKSEIKIFEVTYTPGDYPEVKGYESYGSGKLTLSGDCNPSTGDRALIEENPEGSKVLSPRFSTHTICLYLSA